MRNGSSTPGSTVAYYCKKGFYHHGGTNLSLCTSNGYWTQPSFSCKGKNVQVLLLHPFPSLPACLVLQQSSFSTPKSLLTSHCAHVQTLLIWTLRLVSTRHVMSCACAQLSSCPSTSTSSRGPVSASSRLLDRTILLLSPLLPAFPNTCTQILKIYINFQGVTSKLSVDVLCG